VKLAQFEYGIKTLLGGFLLISQLSPEGGWWRVVGQQHHIAYTARRKVAVPASTPSTQTACQRVYSVTLNDNCQFPSCWWKRLQGLCNSPAVRRISLLYTGLRKICWRWKRLRKFRGESAAAVPYRWAVHKNMNMFRATGVRLDSKRMHWRCSQMKNWTKTNAGLETSPR
jgi:hypothetical protein